MRKKMYPIAFLIISLLFQFLSVTVKAQGAFQDLYNDANKAAGLNITFWGNPSNSIIVIIQQVLPYLFVIAGLILFLILIHAGFVYLTSTTNPDKTEDAKKKITLSLTGFFIIFGAYWIAQALQVMLGIPILGGR